MQQVQRLPRVRPLRTYSAKNDVSMTRRKKLLQLHQINQHISGKKIVLFYQYNNVSTRDWGLLRGELLSEVSRCKPLPVLNSMIGELDGTSSFGGRSTTDKKEFTISTLVVKSKIGQLCLAQALATNLGPALARPRPPMEPAGETEHTAPDPTGKLSLCQDNNTKCAELFQGPTFLFACNSHREMAIGCKVIGNKRDRYSNNHAILLGGIYYGKVVTHLDIAKLSVLDSSIYGSLPMALENKVVSLLVGGLSCQQDELLRCLECHRDNLLRSAPS